MSDRLTVLTQSPSSGDNEDFDAPLAHRSGTRLLDAAPGALAPADADDASTDRWFASWNLRARKAALALLGALALILAWWWWSGLPEPVQSLDSMSEIEGADREFVAEEISGTVLVHVVGKVTNPGVVELPAGSRVLDAIEAAGGTTRDKALETVNLARPVVDGEQIVVGAMADGGGSTTISINSSDVNRLQELPGVGPVIAERIVQWREANGPFRSIDELNEVSGIGSALVEQIRDLASM